ncbi:MAG: hypothetical protein EA001_13825 [Oscillatoriales cyanobacterium]|nr:MAG: hypothetical protein EA001_13825 [Oscillatoriales cyanobacterium]
MSSPPNLLLHPIYRDSFCLGLFWFNLLWLNLFCLGLFWLNLFWLNLFWPNPFWLNLSCRAGWPPLSLGLVSILRSTPR